MDQGEQLVHRWFEDLFSEGDLATADEILAPDVEYHGPESLSPKAVDGVDDIKRYVEVYRGSFPDLEYRIDHVFQSGTELCARWTVAGTYDTDADGTSFVETGIDTFVVEDGKITQVWSAWDTLRMAQELDIVETVQLLGSQ